MKGKIIEVNIITYKTGDVLYKIRNSKGEEFTYPAWYMPEALQEHLQNNSPTDYYNTITLLYEI